MTESQIYTDKQLLVGLAKVIAQGVSGVVGTIPEPEDVTLAQAFAEILNSDSLTAKVLELVAEGKSSERL